ncbi:tyrosine-type recombinase/integrase [Acinetobacter wanghuae]|uniref:Tyrosine-type recombinase/integrase n=1 Tax=Acinetobacter wanghuae TaxID=2662362 RepID=A0A5Q0P6K3_9GAMM|nr:integrase family protein [Acinetobacter wanghuae]MQW91116.1 tyrosine-type recombinase/integrase [Acinetobacter wanghuae]QGA11328.1 tyrosine-type recombinase/integrase [Acinetobacter wanghuae]
MSVTTFKFTTARLTQCSCPVGKSYFIYWDELVKGLGLKTYPTSKKMFIYQSRLGGKVLKISIGVFPNYSIDQARQMAKEYDVMILQGIDPRLEKKRLIEKNEEEIKNYKRQKLLFRDVWDDYLNANKERWRDRTYQDHVRLASGNNEIFKGKHRTLSKPQPIYALLDIPLNELSSNVLSTWLNQENLERPTSAALSFRLVRACLNWADEQSMYTGLLPDRSIHSKKVKQAVTPTKAKKDCLQKEQLASFFKAVIELPNPYISAYLLVTLITGARRNEIATLKWQDVDLKWNTLHISDKIDDDGRIIPLTPFVKQLILNLERHNEYVFYSEKSSIGYIVEPTKSLKIAASNAEIDDITIHGLRRSFKTLSEWVSLPSGIVAQIAGHKPSGTEEKHYTVRPIDLLRKWHIEYEEWILKQAHIKLEL